MPESALDVDEGVAEGDQHRGVAVAEVVQGWFGCGDASVLDGAVECAAGDFALEAGVVKGGGEDDGVGVEGVRLGRR